MIHLTRHPGERRFRRRDVAGCGACCCCCCCCLHSVGSLIGAAMASRLAPPPRPYVPPTRAARASASKHAPAAPVSRPAATALSRHPEAREVLALFVLFWIADRSVRDGEMDRKHFDALADVLRGRVLLVWNKLYPGLDACAYEWALDRVELFATAQKISPAARAALRQRIAPLAKGARRPAPTGYLAHIWKLHLLYIELALAAGDGIISPEVLADVRSHLISHVMVAIAGLDPGTAANARSDAPFSDEVWSAASELVDQLKRDGQLPAAALSVLSAALPTGRAEIKLNDGARCRVCGDALSVWKVVKCAACATPHHADCWSYNSGCATYACGCTDFEGGAPRVAAGKAPPLRYELDRDPPHESSPEARAVNWFWMMVALSCVGTAMLFKESETLGLLICATPFYLLGAAVAAIFVVGLSFMPGSPRAIMQLLRIMWYVFCGGVLGTLLMVAFPVLIGILK